jgi:hypothetical protein
MGHKVSYRTNETIREIIRQMLEGTPIAHTVKNVRVHHCFVRAVRQYYETHRTIPTVSVIGEVKVHTNARTGSREAAMFHQQIKREQQEREERAARRKIPINPTLGAAFPVPRERLMGSRA